MSPPKEITASLDRRSLFKATFFAPLASTVICPLTTTLRTDAEQLRLDVLPSPENGLRLPSQVAIDKITVVLVAKIGEVIGRADETLILRVTRALAVFLAFV